MTKKKRKETRAMMRNNCYFMPKDAKLIKPDVDETGWSDMVVVFTDKGDCETAAYNAKTGLWYDSTDPTGFNNVVKWSPFIMPDDFVPDENLYYGGIEL